MHPISRLATAFVFFAGLTEVVVADELSASGAFTDTFHFSGVFANECTGEDVAFALDCRFVANANRGTDQFHQQCHGTAVGLSSGNEYEIHESFRFRGNIDVFACQGSEEIQDEWRLISKGSLPNESVGFRERCKASVFNEELCLFTCLLLDFGLPKCSGQPQGVANSSRSAASQIGTVRRCSRRG